MTPVIEVRERESSSQAAGILVQWSLLAQGKEEQEGQTLATLGKGRNQSHICGRSWRTVSAGAAVVSSNPRAGLGDHLDLLWRVLAAGAF